MDKHAYFHIPATKQEIIGDRDVAHFAMDDFFYPEGFVITQSLLEDIVDAYMTEERREELVTAIENLGDTDALIIHVPLIPTAFTDTVNFLKHGQHVNTHDQSMSQTQAIQEAIDPWKRRWSSFEGLHEKKPGVSLAGYQWYGLGGTDRRSRRVSLLSCILGTQLFSFANQSDYRRDHIEIVSLLQPKYKSKYEGASYEVLVPSRSIDGIIIQGREQSFKRTVTLRSVPIHRNNEKHAIIHNLDHDCECEWVKNRRIHFSNDKTGKKSGVVFCPHAIAAYMAVMTYWSDTYRAEGRYDHGGYQERPPILQMNPFAVPRQGRRPDVTQFYKQLRGKVMIRVHDMQYFTGSYAQRAEFAEQGIPVDERGNFLHIAGGRDPTRNLRPLNEGELEILLWEFVKKYDSRAFFAKGKKPMNYDWTIQTAK